MDMASTHAKFQTIFDKCFHHQYIEVVFRRAFQEDGIFEGNLHNKN